MVRQQCILVVGNDADFQYIVREEFLREDYLVLSAVSGEDALDILCQASRPKQRPVDLILLDTVLPQLNGLEVLKRIRTGGISATVPVLMLTVKEDLDDRLSAFKAGANDCLAKPCDFQELMARAKALLRIRQMERQLVRQYEAMGAVHEIGQEITSILDLDKVLDLIAEKVIQLVGARRSLFLLLAEDGADLAEVRGCGYSSEHLASFTFAEFKAGLSGWVLRTEKPAITTDAQNDPRQTGVARNRARQFASQSVLVAPVSIDGRIIGTLTAVNAVDDQSFSETDLELVVMLAGQAAVAVQNARLFRQLHETKDRLDSLISSSLDAVIAIDAEKRITAFNARAEAMLGYTAAEMLGCNVAVLYKDIDEGRKIYAVVEEQGVITDCEVMLVDKDRRDVPVLLAAKRIEDSQGKIIGQAGVLEDLRQVRLLEERLNGLALATEAIRQSLDLQSVLEQVVASALTAFPSAERGSIHLYDDRSGLLSRVVSSCPSAPGDLRALSFEVGEGVAGWVYAHNQPVVVSDTRADARYKRIDLLGIPSAKSMICVPLRVQDGVIGVLNLDNLSVTGAFAADDLGSLATFADQAAVAIDHARQFQAIQQEAEDRELLQQISSRISAQVEIGQLLKAIVEGGARLLGVEMAVAHLVDMSTGCIKQSIAMPEELNALYTPPRPRQGLTELIVETGKVLLVPDTTKDARVNPEVVAVGIRSLAGFPLIVRGNVIGALFLNSTEEQFFGEREIDLLSLLVAQAAISIENAELIEKNRLRLKRLEMLATASREMMSNFPSLRLRARLQLILKHLALILDAEATTLFLVEEPGYLTKAACYGHIEENYKVGLKLAIKSEPGSGFTGHVAYMGEMLNVHGDGFMYHLAQAGRGADHLASGKTFSLLAIPLTRTVNGKSRLIGLLVAENKIGHGGHPTADLGFSEEDEWILNIFAESAVITLENAELFDRTSERLAQRVQALQALHEAGKAVTSSLALAEILRRILEQARALTGIIGQQAEYGYLALREGDVLKFLVTDPPDELDGLCEKVGDIYLTGNDRIGIMGRVVKMRKSQLVGDVTSDPDYIEYYGAIRSSLAVPILLGDKVIGVINVEHTQAGAFDQDDRFCLESLAAQAAIAIENARRYEQVQQLQVQVGASTALAWMGMASTTWRHSIEGHAITIQDEIELLAEDMQKKRMDPRLRNRLTKIKRLTQKILDRPITPPLSEEDGVEKVSVNRLLRERIRQLWENEPYQSVRREFDIESPDTTTVRTSPGWLVQVIDILVDNAVEAMAEVDDKHLIISTRAVNEGVEIGFTDSGPGIPKPIRPRLFKERISESRGMGMGLLMALVILQTYGGDVYIGSSGPGSTTLCVWLPVEA